MLFVWFGLGGLALVAGAHLLATAFSAGSWNRPWRVVWLLAASTAPELALSLRFRQSAYPELVTGMLIGSSLTNLLLVIGIAAVIAPLPTQARWVRLDVPFVTLATFAWLLLGWDLVITPTEGSVLVAALIVYIVVALRQHRGAEPHASSTPAAEPLRTALVRIPMGLAAIAVGAWAVQYTAPALVAEAALDGYGLGLTMLGLIVAAPELILAFGLMNPGARERAHGVVASALSGVAVTLVGAAGVAAIGLGGLPVPPRALSVDIPALSLASLAFLPILKSGGQITRREGIVLVGVFAVYFGYVSLR